MVSVDQLIEHNPHLRGAAGNHIVTDDVVFLPNTSPSIAANTPRNGGGIPQGEEAFATNLYEQGNDLEYADNPAATDYAAETAGITDDVQGYLEALPANERQDAAQRLYDQDWRDAGPAQQAIEQAAGRMGLQLDPSTHSGTAVDDPVRDIVTGAQAKNGPVEQLKALNEGYANASPEVRNALLRSEGARGILQGAADWAVRGLQELPENAGDQVPVRQLMERLNTATEGMNKDIATSVVTKALPGIEAAYQESLNNPDKYPAGALTAGPGGARALTQVAGRIAGTPEGDAAIGRFVDMGFYNSSGVRQAIAEGANPAYAIRYAAEVGGQGGEQILQNDVLGGINDFRAKIGRTAEAYNAHMEELNWLSTNYSGVMTPERLQETINDYKASKPGFEQTEQQLKGALEADGTKLLDQLGTLANLPPELAGQQEAANQAIRDTVGDAKSFEALQVAARQESGRLSPETLRTIGQVGRLTDRGRKLAEEAATQILQREILPKFQDLNPNDAASLTRARDAVESLRDGRLSNLLGIADGDLDKVVKTLENALPPAGVVEPFEQMRARVDTFNKEVEKLTGPNGSKSFHKSEFPGQVLRTIGLAGNIASLFASANTAEANPSLKNNLKILIDTAGIAQKTIELSEGLGALDSGSNSAKLFGSSTKPAVKVLGALGAAFDFWNAYDYAKAGDNVSAGLSAAAGAGTIAAAVGTGTMAGPIGLAVVGAAVIGQMIWDDIKQSNIHMNETSANFLQHAGFDKEAATALVDQSGDGHSPVPILVKYAELKGFNMEDPTHQRAFVDWINNIPPENLAALRDNLHHTLDEIGGDVSKFNATAPNDADRIWDTQQRPWFTRSGVAKPESAAQLDAMLPILEIPMPVPPPAPAGGNSPGTGSGNAPGGGNNSGGGNNVTAPNGTNAPAANTPDSTPGASPRVPLSASDRDHVIRTIWGEAANEPAAGQEAVAHVIRNRVVTGQWGDSATDVVLARSQFEPWNTAAGRERMQSLSSTSAEYQRIGAIVDRVFAGEVPDNTHGATHFYAPAAQAALARDAPDWATNRLATIGGHEFYAPNGAVG
jgi:spore germination cell wall hydrolase CwlJ-like protein